MNKDQNIINPDKMALAVYYLDSGLYNTSTVAKAFKISIRDLESSTEFFKKSDAYKKGYKIAVEEDIRKNLSDLPFTGKNDIYYRLLKNGRIEVILIEGSGKKFYHAFIPGKDYLDNIYLNKNVWVDKYSLLDSCSMTVDEWKTIEYPTQITLLRNKFEKEDFLPYTIRITRDEYKALINNEQAPDIVIPSQKAVEGSSARRVEDIPEENTSFIQMVKKGVLSFFRDNVRESINITSDEQKKILELYHQSDEQRLKTILDRGGDVECFEEDYLVYLDPFYERVHIKKAIIEKDTNSIVDNINTIYKGMESERNERNDIEELNSLLEEILNESNNSILFDKIIELVHSDMHSIDIFRKIIASNKALESENPLLRHEILAAISEDTIKNEDDDKTVGEQLEDNHDELKEKRGHLLELMKVNPTDLKLRRAFQETESVLANTAPKPKWFPEEDELYVSLIICNIINTSSAVLKRVIGRCSADELQRLRGSVK